MKKNLYMRNRVGLAFAGLCIGLVASLSAAPTPLYAQSTSNTGIVVAEAAQPSVAEGLLERIYTTWPWYVARAAGIVAAIVLVILMLSGIGFITGTTYSFLEPITAWATHRALGITLAIAVVLHVVGLYFDSFVPFNLGDLLIPFKSAYRPVDIFGVSVGSLYVALGILAFYLLALNIFTSLVWIDNKPRTWKIVHLLSYITVLFVFVHALFLGTDLAHGVLRAVWIGLGVAVLAAALVRLWRANTV